MAINVAHNERISAAYGIFKEAVQKRSPSSDIGRALETLLELSPTTPSFKKYVRDFLPMCNIPKMKSSVVLRTFGTLLLDIEGEDTSRAIFDSERYLVKEKIHYDACRRPLDQSSKSSYTSEHLRQWSTEIKSRSRKKAPA